MNQSINELINRVHIFRRAHPPLKRLSFMASDWSIISIPWLLLFNFPSMVDFRVKEVSKDMETGQFKVVLSDKLPTRK